MNRSIVKILITTTLVVASTSFAADAEVLFGGKDMSHGGFGAMETKLTRIDGHTRALSGGKGAYIMDHGLYMGFGGYGMSMGYDAGIPDSAGNPQYVQMGYGGLLFGYTFNSDKLVHLGVEVLAGAGGYVLTDKKYGGDDCEQCDEDAWENEIEENANVFAVIDPQVLVELNLAKYVRLSAGVGYRFEIFPEEKHGISSMDQSGVTGVLP